MDSCCGATHLTLSVGDDTLYHVVNPTFRAPPVDICCRP